MLKTRGVLGGIAAIAAICALSLSLVACGSQTGGESTGTARSESNSAAADHQVSVDASSSSGSAASTSSASASSASTDYASMVSIEGDYSYETRYAAYHVLIVKNNSDATLKIASNSTAVDASGNLIGADDADTRAVGPGCTSYLLEHYNKVSGVAKYETVITASVDTHTSVLQDLDLSATAAGSNVIVQCTNTGTHDAEFVQALVLFFDGDTLVDSEERYLSNGTEPLGPDETRSEQMSTRESYDSVSAYLSGRGK